MKLFCNLSQSVVFASQAFAGISLVAKTPASER